MIIRDGKQLGKIFITDKWVQRALRSFDFTLSNDALELIVKLHPYVLGQKKAPEILMSDLHVAYNVSFRHLFFQADTSGLTEAILRFILREWRRFSFLEMLDILEQELPYFEQLGYTRSDIQQRATLLEKDKEASLKRLEEIYIIDGDVSRAHTGPQFAPKISGYCSQSGKIRKGDEGFWCVLFGVNAGLGDKAVVGGLIAAAAWGVSLGFFGAGCLVEGSESDQEIR